MNTTDTEEKPSEKQVAAKRHLGPFFVLLVLAPVVAELLLGDVPLNASLPFLMVLNLSYYGTGAIIVREIVRRRGLSWAWIPILAFTYGLIEEGLVLHSLFNPNFPGVGSLGFYGRALGVDWIWATFVLGLHTVWSLPVPILVTELLFPRYRKERWIGNVGFTVCCVTFVLAMAFLASIFAYLSAAQVTAGFAPSPIALIITAILVLAILLLALFIPVQPAAATAPQIPGRNTPHPWLVGAFAFLMGGLFLGTEEIFRSWALPAPFAFLVYLILAVVAVVVIRLWSAPSHRWQDTHRVALSFGALLDYCLFGLVVTRSDSVNQVFHGVLALITIVLMVLLTLRVRARIVASSQAMRDQVEICTFHH